MTVRVTFQQPDGTVATVDGQPGMTLMEVARESGIEGILAECGGGAICSTCHVRVCPTWFAAVGEASQTEDMLLELAPGRSEFSRLSCQITLTAAHDGLSVTVPEEQADY